jgi:hypothetical protein
VERIPPPVLAGNSADENAWKNCWNWNLTDAAFGQLVLDVKEGRVNAEMRSQGFNYAYRRQTSPNTAADGNASPLAVPNQQAGTAPPSAPITKPGTPSGQPKNLNLPKSTPPLMSKGGTPAPEGDSVNGQASGDKDASKKDKKKQKEKEKKAEKAADKVAGQEQNGQSPAGKGKRAGANGVVKLDTGEATSTTTEDAALSPGGADSIGAHTPTGRRGSRNPWTLFIKHLPVPVTEDEIKDFFGDAKSGVSATLLLCYSR